MLRKSKMRPALILFLGYLGVWHAALAQDAIRISDAWINEAPPGMKMMGGYLSISNNTLHDIVLTGATSPCFKKIEFHVTEIKNGISSMHKQETITIPSGSVFSFSPGHYHLMMINQTRKLAANTPVPVTLHFAGGDSLEVLAEFRRGEAHSHDHH